MKYMLQALLMGFTIFWLSACTTSSPILLETTPSVTSQAEVVLPQETQPIAVNQSDDVNHDTDISQQSLATTSEVVESISKSPLAPPTMTPVPKESTPINETPTTLPVATPTSHLETEPILATVQPPVSIMVISDEPLVFDVSNASGAELKNQINSFSRSSELENQMVLLGWTDTAEIVIRPGYEGSPLPGQSPTPTPGPSSQWAISPETGKVSSVPDWQQYVWSDEQEQLSQKLDTSLAEYPKIPSPDGKRIAVSQFGQKLLVYDVTNTDQLPLSLPPLDPNGPDIFAYIMPVWSVDGSKLAYVAATKQNAHEITGVENIYPNAHPYLQIFQIHVYDFSEHSLMKLDLPYVSYSPTSLDMSPDNRFLAFVAPPERQTHSHLFVMNLNNLTKNDLTPDWENTHPEYFWPNAVFWSPLGNRIAYGDTATGIIYVMSLKLQ